MLPVTPAPPQSCGGAFYFTLSLESIIRQFLFAFSGFLLSFLPAIASRSFGKLIDFPMRIKSIVTRIDSEFPTGATLVAEQEGELVGVLTISLSEPAGFVRSLFVSPEVRGQGLGRKLLLQAISLCHDFGHTGVGLSVKDTNLIAQALYKSLGFVPHAQDYEGYTQYLHVFPKKQLVASVVVESNWSGQA